MTGTVGAWCVEQGPGKSTSWRWRVVHVETGLAAVRFLRIKRDAVEVMRWLEAHPDVDPRVCPREGCRRLDVPSLQVIKHRDRQALATAEPIRPMPDELVVDRARRGHCPEHGPFDAEPEPDRFAQLVTKLATATTLDDLDVVVAERDGWAAEHDAVLALRRAELSSRFDVDTVAAAAREQLTAIEDERAAESDDPRHGADWGEGWRLLLAWLAQLDALPTERVAWPCPVCCAEAGAPCDLPGREDSWTGPGPRFHFDRGWSRSWGSTRPESIEGCWPTVADGPGHTHRGECVGCAWIGPVRAGRRSESAGVHDAHDHVWPGWRDLPIVPRPPKGETNPKTAAKAEARWRREIAEMLPDGWLEAGGPIRTERVRPGTRDVPHGAPGGGYDIAVVLEAPRGATLHDLADPEPANEAVQGETRRSCAASGHLRRRGPDGEVVYQGRVYCRCGRASYEPREAAA